MDATAKPASKHKPSQTEFPSMLAGRRRLNAADFSHFVQRNWPTVLKYPQDMQPPMVGEALKNSFLAAVRSLCFAHTISKFAKILT
jgi:hypothetical protein